MLFGIPGTTIAGILSIANIVISAKELSTSRPSNPCGVYKVTITNTYYAVGYGYSPHLYSSTSKKVLYYGIEDETNNMFYLPEYGKNGRGY